MYFFPQVRKRDTQENLHYLQCFPSPLKGMRQACRNLLHHLYVSYQNCEATDLPYVLVCGLKSLYACRPKSDLLSGYGWIEEYYKFCIRNA